MTFDLFNRLADLACLKKRVRGAVSLIELDGMTGEAAARQMDLNRSTVARAHAKFKRAATGKG